MTDRSKILIGGVVLVTLGLAGLAYARPGYFTNLSYLSGILFFEVLVAGIWMYRRVYFSLVLFTFLLAGVDLPVGSIWNVVRWVTMGVGAFVGVLVMTKERRFSFHFFHLVALFAVLAALVSASVSRYTALALLKALSLVLLFVYAGTGARLAVLGREKQFFSDLLNGCEVFVGAVAALYIAGIEVMGNPNSLGAVMGVVAAPLLLWGTFACEERQVRWRHAVMFVICSALIFFSNARAGMAAALVSCGVLCLALRRYKSLAQGIVVIAIVVSATAIFHPETYSNTVTSLTNHVVFKGKDLDEGLLASRQLPWQQAVNSIQDHVWFGTGFGTSDNGEDAADHLGRFSTTVAASTEHGSSYLAIATWVGITGVLPFLILLLMILKRVLRIVVWMGRTASPVHPSVPLAMVVLAGIIHAGFEDWLFAPGYYLTVFFWSMAFILEDYDPVRTKVALHYAPKKDNALGQGLLRNLGGQRAPNIVVR